MPFVKLDCGILNSSLWPDRDARELFITALLMASPCDTEEPMEQIEVRVIRPTGFIVPVGWYGFVEASGLGIIRQAGLEREAGLAALERLGAADEHSRSDAWEGRRMVRVDGGYIILNYMPYREKDHTAAERARRYRDRKREDASRRDVTPSRRNVTQADAENRVHTQEEGGSVNRAREAAAPVKASPPPQQPIASPGEAGEQAGHVWTSSRDATHIAQRWAAKNPGILDPAKAGRHFAAGIAAGIPPKALMEAVEANPGRKPWELVDALKPKLGPIEKPKLTPEQLAADVDRLLNNPEDFRRRTT